VEYTLVITNTDVAMISPETGEAITRTGMFVNGTRPGPTLEINVGDTVIANVANNMLQASTTIHFHGQHQQGTYYYDGGMYCQIVLCSIFSIILFTLL
jgi:FtsP/CotA-like multicopper oxidase with cupredoxin domain